MSWNCAPGVMNSTPPVSESKQRKWLIKWRRYCSDKLQKTKKSKKSKKNQKFKKKHKTKNPKKSIYNSSWTLIVFKIIIWCDYASWQVFFNLYIVGHSLKAKLSIACVSSEHSTWHECWSQTSLYRSLLVALMSLKQQHYISHLKWPK